MPKLDWVKDLVRSEEQMEESGIVDLSIGFDNERTLAQESLNLLQTLKNEFIEASTAFNEMKASALGRIKIYGIAKTQADFMLFRNGFKMIFSLTAPGQISIRFNFMGPNYSSTPTAPAAPKAPAKASASVQPNAAAAIMGGAGAGASTTGPMLMEEHLLIAKKGSFGDLMWTFRDKDIRMESVVRYHMTLFIKESAK